MTMPVPTPDAPRPSTTTAPPETVKFIKNQLPYLHMLAHVAVPTPDDAATKRNVANSADELRRIFPHLDDTTLAAFVGYAATGCTQAGQIAQCMDLIAMGATWAEVALHMAWQLATPDGESPNEAS